MFVSLLYPASRNLVAVACDYLQLLVITCYFELLVTVLGEGQDNQVHDLMQGVCDKSQHHKIPRKRLTKIWQ